MNIHVQTLIIRKRFQKDVIITVKSYCIVAELETFSIFY